jgi:hypothetical protein
MTREIRISIRTFRHTAFVVDDIENACRQALPKIKSRNRDCPFKRGVIGNLDLAIARDRGAATKAVQLQSVTFFLIGQNTLELRFLFLVGNGEPLCLIQLCLLNHCRSD